MAERMARAIASAIARSMANATANARQAPWQTDGRIRTRRTRPATKQSFKRYCDQPFAHPRSPRTSTPAHEAAAHSPDGWMDAC